MSLKSFVAKHKDASRTAAIFLAAFTLFVGSAIIIWLSTFRVPSLAAIQERRVAESTKIYDATGDILLYDLSQNTKRTIVPLEEISDYAQKASIAIEDRDFYNHHGVKPTSFARAMLVNLTTLSFNQGGSTITQQVIKNSILTNEKWLSRKLKEWVLAVQLENILSKEDILSMYLNEIPYGGTMYGIEEASETFFGKKAKDVNLTEAAYLAAIPKAPTYYSPYGKNRERLEERKNLVLSQMFKENMITEEEYKKSKEEVIDFKPKEDSGIKAPHFVFYVIDYLKDKYGADVLEKGGLKVKTTLNYELQVMAQDIAHDYAHENETKFKASNAAITAVDPKTGGILVMVGSRDYFDTEIDGAFNVTLGKRQPGSTFKPFVYAEAFKKGYTPETNLFDVKTQFASNCAPDNLTSENSCYSPDNYDMNFRGPISIRNALAQSINVPAVKTLYLVGVQDAIRLARDMGMETLSNRGNYGLTLVLGGGEVTPLEITSAYGVFANEGMRNVATPIMEITDKTGNTIEKLEPKPTQILDKEVALKISDVLSDNEARAPAFGQSSFLHFPNTDVAVKTGTTNDYRDAWIIGYTPSIAVGAWAGNNDNSQMDKKVAGFIVAPMWRAFMDRALALSPSESFEEPSPDQEITLKPVLRGKWQGGESVLIDKVSKRLITEFTPKDSFDEILTGGIHNILHWVNRSDPRGPAPENPQNDSQYSNWEYGVQKWVRENNIVEPLVNIPNEYDNIHNASSIPRVNITNPNENSTFAKNENVIVSFSISNGNSITKTELSLNGIKVAESSSKTSSLSFVPGIYGIESGSYTLAVTVSDAIHNKVIDEITINIE
jgi:1A family penicillin-binding protein